MGKLTKPVVSAKSSASVPPWLIAQAIAVSLVKAVSPLAKLTVKVWLALASPSGWGPAAGGRGAGSKPAEEVAGPVLVSGTAASWSRCSS